MNSPRILLTVFLLTAVPSLASAHTGEPTRADSSQVFYAEQNVTALQRLFEATDDRALDLLCRYRLYPLTRDPVYLKDLPTALKAPTARELALLSGLWGYKVMESSLFNAPRYGLRANRLLDEARALDPTDPFVLLIEGQSLLFRPALFGGDVRAALERFHRLQEVLGEAPEAGLSRMEADLWVWYAHVKLGAEEAPALREALLAQNPPPLYQQFLMDPP